MFGSFCKFLSKCGYVPEMFLLFWQIKPQYSYTVCLHKKVQIGKFIGGQGMKNYI